MYNTCITHYTCVHDTCIIHVLYMYYTCIIHVLHIYGIIHVVHVIMYTMSCMDWPNRIILTGLSIIYLHRCFLTL